MNKKIIIGIIVIVALVIAGFGGYSVYKNSQIEKMQNATITSIEEMYNVDDYRKAEQKHIAKLKENSENAVKAVKTQEEMDEIAAEYKAAVAEIKTDAQLTAAEKKAAEKARKKAEERARQQAAAAAAKAKAAKAKKKKKKSGGCVSDDAANFY